MADETKPKGQQAASSGRAARPSSQAAAQAPPVVSTPAARTLTRNEREALRARLQKKFH